MFPEGGAPGQLLAVSRTAVRIPHADSDGASTWAASELIRARGWPLP